MDSRHTEAHDNPAMQPDSDEDTCHVEHETSFGAEHETNQNATKDEPIHSIGQNKHSGEANPAAISPGNGGSRSPSESRTVIGQSQSASVIGRENGRTFSGNLNRRPVKNVGPVELLSVAALAETHTEAEDEVDENAKQALEVFVSKKRGNCRDQLKSRKLRSYYKNQDLLIMAFEDLSKRSAFDSTEDTTGNANRLAAFYSKITFATNLVLLAAKVAASIMSSSMSIISSLVDSVVDLLSGIIMWWAARAIRKRDPHDYPQGRSKLEPIAIVILSVVMGLASVQLIRESGEKIGTIADDHSALPDMELPTFLIAGSTVVIKFILWVICRRVQSPIVQALALDHRNDVASNTVAIVCGYLGSKNFKASTNLTEFIYTDPIGAILISLYIIYNWWKTGSEQIRMLTGHTASRDFLSKMTWISMNHDPRITHIDTLRAYHYGNFYIVKVHIVLPETMYLREAHDIGESLQVKLESFPEVERAYVHVDYDYVHKPTSEHKII